MKAGWPELMEMLQNGEIDLMGDVSYTPERAEGMLFSELLSVGMNDHVAKPIDIKKLETILIAILRKS